MNYKFVLIFAFYKITQDTAQYNAPFTNELGGFWYPQPQTQPWPGVEHTYLGLNPSPPLSLKASLSTPISDNPKVFDRKPASEEYDPEEFTRLHGWQNDLYDTSNDYMKNNLISFHNHRNFSDHSKDGSVKLSPEKNNFKFEDNDYLLAPIREVVDGPAETTFPGKKPRSSPDFSTKIKKTLKVLNDFLILESNVSNSHPIKKAMAAFNLL